MHWRTVRGALQSTRQRSCSSEECRGKLCVFQEQKVQQDWQWVRLAAAAAIGRCG
jgi:hypothetical protein